MGVGVAGERFAVIGGGAWGSALAVHLGRAGRPVRLWIHDPALVTRMRERRDNPAHLPGIRVPDAVCPVERIEEALEDCCVALVVVPSQFSRAAYRAMRPALAAGVPLVVGTKGIEEQTLALPLDVAREELGGAQPLAVLSGPSFALEVAQGRPTAVVIASSDPGLAVRLQDLLASRTLRIYTNADPLGVQLAGCLKNVMAIAVGLADSLGLGSNAVAGLITRGLAEMSRLVLALGGNATTTSGLAGLGDLVLTCTGDQSRNRRVGQRLGRGERLEDILAGNRSIAEGVRGARSVRELGRRAGVAMPIVEEVCRILYEDGSPSEGLERLLDRPLTSEEPAVPGPWR